MRRGRFAGLNYAAQEAKRSVPGGAGASLFVLSAPVVLALAAVADPRPAIVAAAAAFAILLALVGLVRLRAQHQPAARQPDAGEMQRASGFVEHLEQSGGGWFWETNADGVLTYLSEPLARALERDPREMIGRPFLDLLLVEDAGPSDVQRPTIGFHLSSRFPFADVPVSPNGRKDLSWSLSGQPRFDEIGRFLGFRGIGLNLNEEQREEAQSSRLATVDSLTGLPNRARMQAMLDEALANSMSRKEGCALFLVDLDRFKQVNDTLGHQMGDLLLKEVAHRLSAVIGSEGQAGRLGGDEFQAILPGIDEEGRLAALAERLIGKLSAPYVVRGHPITIGASVGIAISRPGRTLADALMKEADLALYAAKAAGRGTFRFFESEMHTQESERHILENDLRRAVAKGQLRLVFQPVISATTEDLVGFEALVRWMHPVRGLLPPAEFLAVAEASGLISGIGEWVIRTACAEAARWPTHLHLAVNLSPVQLEQPETAAVVANALASSQLDPDRLELDIVETALLAECPSVASVIASLKALGVRLALDDFGLGVSSLIGLKSAPLDRVKIHPGLLRAALPGGRAKAVLAGLVNMAASLDMAVTAEGAETLEELALIRELGCTEIQGFLFGRPIASDEALHLAAQSQPVSAQEAVQSRPPRHSLIRRGAMLWRGGSFPVRLRNISADGAMVESPQQVEPGAEVELDLADGVRLTGQVRWSQDGRIGLKFAAPFDLQRLGRAGRASSEAFKPDYLKSELKADSPWAARSDRLTIKDVRRKNP